MASAEHIRHHLRFDVARLKSAALQLQEVDRSLRSLKKGLEARARTLSVEASGAPNASLEGLSGPIQAVPLRAAQAQATAELARRAALGEVLKHSGALPLIASMAVARWIEAILTSIPSHQGDGCVDRRASLAKGHIDAGRIAHRMLATLRSRAGLRSGCGLLVCSVVVAELAPRDLHEFLEEQVEEGMARALGARGVATEEDALLAASAALREGARLLESMARKAQPAARELLNQASTIEDRVAKDLSPQARKAPGSMGTDYL